MIDNFLNSEEDFDFNIDSNPPTKEELLNIEKELAEREYKRDINYFNILFNNIDNTEILSFYSTSFLNNTYESRHEVSKQLPLGSFIIYFMNFDFSKKDDFESFVSFFCLESLYSKIHPDKLNKTLNQYFFTLSKTEYSLFMDEAFKRYNETFIYYSNLYREILDIKSNYINMYNQYSISDPNKALDYKEKLKNLTPKYYLNNFYEKDYDFSDVSLDTRLYDFFPTYEFNFLNTFNFTYKSSDIFDILFLSFVNLSNSDYLVCKCENCGKYFIPTSKHEVKYCDFIYEDGKTCRELAPNIIYKKRLEESELLKKYRTRYQTLEKLASHYAGKNIEKYENYKKEGALKKAELKKGLISAYEFNEWINNTKKKRS